jgi:hypothetical protein
MASLSKFLKSPKSYAAKKFSSGIKTVKEQPLTLAAQVLSTMSEVAQNHNNYQKGLPGAMSPLASLFRGGAQLTQGWQNAKLATKKNQRARDVSAIINAAGKGKRNEEGEYENPNGIKTMDKVSQLVSLGEHKAANDLMKLHGLKKAIKDKKRNFQQKVKMDDFNVFNSNRNFDESAQNNKFNREHKTDTFNWKKNVDTYNIQHGEQKEQRDENRWGAEQTNKTERAVIAAIGNLLKKGGTPEQLITLIRNNSLVNSLGIKRGIPGLTGGSVKINEPHYLPDDDKPKKTNALKKFLEAIRDK